MQLPLPAAPDYSQALRYLGVPEGDAGRCHHAGKAAVGGKSRDCVHLIEHNPSLRRQEHVHPGEALAAQDPVNLRRRPADLLRLFPRNPRRHMDR